MRRAFALWAVALVACRGNFDAAPDAAVDAPAAEPLPAFACARAELAIEPVGPRADIAATRDGDAGSVVAWIDPDVRRVELARLDRSRALLATGSFVASDAAAVAGLEQAGAHLWVVTAGASQTLWRVDRALTAAVKVAAEDTVAGHDPIGLDTAAQRPVWVRGERNAAGWRLAQLQDDGSLGTTALAVAPARATSLSSGDYENHVHFAWSDTAGQCRGGDIFSGNLGNATPNFEVTGDCQDIRVLSDAPAGDPLIITWTNPATGVHARYIDVDLPGGRKFDVALGPGGASKMAYDNELYWVAWSYGGELAVASIDSNGVTTRFTQTGLRLLNDQAFELVRRGNSVELVRLGEKTLTIYKLCAS